MSNFNDKIKALLAFSASFEEFKSEVETKLNQLNKPTDSSGLVKREELETKLNQLSKPTDLSGLVKKEDLNSSIGKLSEELEVVKLDAFAFDSARRTFGEEIGVLKSFVDKGFKELRKEFETLKGSDELEFLASALSDLDKQLESVRNSIVEPKSYDDEIKEFKSLIEKIPAQKDYSKDIAAVKGLIKPAKSYDAEIKELVKKEDLNSSIGKLSEELEVVKLDAFAFDSARRTFGEEIGVLKSFVDKGFKELRKEFETLIEKTPVAKNYDKELAQIESNLSGFANTEQVKKLLAELPKPKDFSVDIVKLEGKLKAIKLPADKSLEVESLLSRVRKLEDVKPVDYSQEIVEVKKLIPAQIDNSEQIQELTNQLESALSKVNVKLSELSNLEKQVKRNAIIADSARRTFGEEIGALKSYIDKEFSKLKGGNNG